MQCREAVFAEDVLVYVLDNYRGVLIVVYANCDMYSPVYMGS